MTEVELLPKVKSGLGITGSYQDETLKIYINDVKAFMISAGVSKEIADSDASVGVIVRGVADLWNLESGSAKFSTYFLMRVTQLAVIPVSTTEVV
ncbi:MAG: phage gp6-like head-tail connector protein [Candidatus Dehalobacter alkaniphilus]